MRASARLMQLGQRLLEEETQRLVSEAEEGGDIIFMVELDPDEGSGVIPRDWAVYLQPKGAEPGLLAEGSDTPRLRQVRALNGVLPRNYDYDRFFIVFSFFAKNGEPLFAASVSEAELIVRIHGKEKRLRFTVPLSVKERIARRIREGVKSE